MLNILRHLNHNGIIIMQHCLPPHKAAALPTTSFPDKSEQNSVEGWTREWCGDVWKTIVYLHRHLSGPCSTCVLDTDYGLGIIRFNSTPEEVEHIID